MFSVSPFSCAVILYLCQDGKKNEAAGSASNGGGGKCFNCGQSGHKASNCPNRLVRDRRACCIMHYLVSSVRSKGAGGSWKGPKQTQWNKSAGKGAGKGTGKW